MLHFLLLFSLLLFSSFLAAQTPLHYVIRTVAGYLPTPAVGQATATVITRPTAVGVDRAGNVYIASSATGALLKVDSAGVISTPTRVYAYDFAFDAAGNLSCAGFNSVYRISPEGQVTAFAGRRDRGAQRQRLW